MSDAVPMSFWNQIPYMDRDATLMGPSRDMHAQGDALRSDLGVKSNTILPIGGTSTVQLKTSMRPMTSSSDSRGLDPNDQDPRILVRNSNQNPAAAGEGSGGAVWKNAGSSSGSRPWYNQEGPGARGFLEGLNITPPTLYTAMALGLVAWLMFKGRN